MVINPQDIRLLRRLTTKSKIIILLLLAFTFLIGFALPFLLTRSSNPSVPNTKTPNPKPVSVAAVPSQKIVAPKSSFTIAITISSPDTNIDAADFVVYFDPEILKPLKIENGDFFTTIPVRKIEDNFVKISATATFADNKIIFPQGQGTVATINFLALKKANDSLIYFDPDKTIVGSGGKNVLEKLSDAKITIK
ncbi:hypothetical protein HYW54_04930 [Candidatus Gottesmanbacteria bacterium]|nr:hypothetical protein [Candidatus Gottesmanbacteria bacterium]